MNIAASKIDSGTFQELLQLTKSMAPFYAPEWNALHDKEPGIALIKIYLHIYEQIISRLNQVPDKNLIAFLDMLGIKQLPAQSATAPITFSLAEGAKENVLVPKGTQLTAQSVDESEEILFETQKNLIVSAAALKEIFSINASKDKIFNHTQKFNDKNEFEIFNGSNTQEHSLYLGHSDLLNLVKPSKIEVDFVISSGASGGKELEFTWEYWNGTYWVTLANLGKDYSNDKTNRFRKSGTMTLEKKHSGEIALTTVNKIETRWIRCRIKPEKTILTAVTPIELPTINTIRLSVNPISPLTPDLAFNNDIPLIINTINVSMMGMDIDIDFLTESPPSSPPVISDQFLVLDYSPSLEIGDILEFNNNIDDPIRREIKNIASINDENNYGIVEFTEKIELKPDEPYKIRMITAIREADANIRIDVRVDSLEGYDIQGGSKIYLSNSQEGYGYIRDETQPLPESPLISETDTLSFESAKKIGSYIEGDILKIIPKIKPFGELPRLFDTFYIANDEAFSKIGAKITLIIESGLYDPDSKLNSSPEVDEPKPVLSWEYWNGISWKGIRVADTTNNFHNNFIKEGTITFTCPDDIKKAKVNGEEKFWIRTRIIDGDYGKEIVLKNSNSNGVRAVEGNVFYPVITELLIDYEDIEKKPQHCLTYNNLNYKNRTNDCKDIDKRFDPFKLLPEQYSSLFLGFDRQLISGPLQILFSLEEQFLADEDQLKINWFYWDAKQWAQLNVVDKTENLTKIGILEWIGSRNITKSLLFGKKLFWLKASVVEGEFVEKSENDSEKPGLPTIKGIYPNTTYAFQAFVVEDEILGSSDLTANQEFSVLKPPIISQDVWVKEPKIPTEEIKKKILDEEGADAIKEVKNEAGETEEIWIQWHEVEDFDDSNSESRHYIVKKRLGTIQFGDGENGKIPEPGEDNIKASYKYGGGKNGNVIKGAITGLKNAIPFVKEIVNNLAADGGSETETLDQVLLRGPQRLKNRDRAVTTEDFEWLAKNASGKVARAKCIPNYNETGEFAPGWVTIIIIPGSEKNKPVPTRQLIKTVTDQLAKQSANIIYSPDHIFVRGSDYIKVAVETTVIPTTTEAATSLEKNIQQSLKKYIHPLTGGLEQNGWQFGKNICLSEIFALIEGIKNVDFVEKLELRADGVKQKQDIILDKFTMPYSGEHKISMKLQTGEAAATEKLKKTECEEDKNIATRIN